MAPHLLGGLGVVDLVLPVVIAMMYIAINSWIPEPTRQKFNAIFVAGAGSAYLSGGGLGGSEFLYSTIATIVAYKGLRSYRYIAIAWLMHALWDVVHHFYGNPIVPFSPTSSAGCAISDTVWAVWFLFGAPSLFGRLRRNGAHVAHVGP